MFRVENPNEYSLRRSVGEFPSPLRNDSRLPYKLDCENWLCYGRPLRSLSGERQAPLCFPLVCRSSACLRACTYTYTPSSPLCPLNDPVRDLISISESQPAFQLLPNQFPTVHTQWRTLIVWTLIIPMAERVDSNRWIMNRQCLSPSILFLTKLFGDVLFVRDKAAIKILPTRGRRFLTIQRNGHDVFIINIYIDDLLNFWYFWVASNLILQVINLWMYHFVMIEKYFL